MRVRVRRSSWESEQLFVGVGLRARAVPAASGDMGGGWCTGGAQGWLWCGQACSGSYPEARGRGGRRRFQGARQLATAKPMFASAGRGCHVTRCGLGGAHAPPKKTTRNQLAICASDGRCQPLRRTNTVSPISGGGRAAARWFLRT